MRTGGTVMIDASSRREHFRQLGDLRRRRPLRNPAAVTIRWQQYHRQQGEFRRRPLYGRGTVKITNSSISGNTTNTAAASCGYGGTVMITEVRSPATRRLSRRRPLAAGGTVTITNSSISGNTATTGGGLYVYHTSAR